MSILKPIANEIAQSGSGVDSSRDCSRVLTLKFKRILVIPEMEFKEFEPRFKSGKIRQNPGLNLVPA